MRACFDPLQFVVIRFRRRGIGLGAGVQAYIHTLQDMEYEWEPAKTAANLRAGNREVALNCPAAGLNLLHNLQRLGCALLIVEVMHCHLRTLLGEKDRNRLPDTGTRACD